MCDCLCDSPIAECGCDQAVDGDVVVNAVVTARILRWSEIRVYGQLWSLCDEQSVSYTTLRCRALLCASEAVVIGDRSVNAALEDPAGCSSSSGPWSCRVVKKVEYASGLNARLVHGTNTGRSVAGAPETTVASTSQPIPAAHGALAFLC